MIECGRQSLLHRRRRMMTDANLENVLDESHELISSARVEGTPVFNPKGEKLGSVHSVMIHKHTGQVAYAVLSFGGFLGIGRSEEHTSELQSLMRISYAVFCLKK